LNTAVEGFEKTDVEGGDAIFVDDERAMGGVDVAKDTDRFTSEFHDDEITHIGVEIGAGDGGGDVTAFVGVDEDRD
jgi:hypothetical protein